MKSNTKKLKNCKVRMTVEVEAPLVEDRFQEVFRKLQRAAALPGFRQGKAPMDLIEKQYSGEAAEEVLKTLVPEAYHRSVISQKVSPVSLPSISEIKMTRGSALSFTAEFENAPEFNLKNYKGIRIDKPSIEVAPEDVKKGMASLLESRAELVPVLELRAVREGDILLTDVEVWKDGQYADCRKGVPLLVKPNPGDDFFEKVLGAQVSQSIEVSAEPNEEEKKQGLIGRKPIYKITIHQIQEKRLPALDDELAKHFGKETVGELESALHKDVASYKQSESYERMKEQLFEKLLSLAGFELPQGLVQKQKERLIEQARRRFEELGIPDAERQALEKKAREEADPRAANQIKLYFILQKVAELEELHADELEVENRLRALVEESGRPLEEVRSVFEEDVRESMREKKTVEFLLANAKLEETKIK